VIVSAEKNIMFGVDAGIIVFLILEKMNCPQNVSIFRSVLRYINPFVNAYFTKKYNLLAASDVYFQLKIFVFIAIAILNSIFKKMRQQIQIVAGRPGLATSSTPIPY